MADNCHHDKLSKAYNCHSDQLSKALLTYVTFQKETPLYILATAGMRLLEKDAQEAVLGSLRKTITENTNFYFPSPHLEIISGKQVSAVVFHSSLAHRLFSPVPGGCLPVAGYKLCPGKAGSQDRGTGGTCSR